MKKEIRFLTSDIKQPMETVSTETKQYDTFPKFQQIK